MPDFFNNLLVGCSASQPSLQPEDAGKTVQEKVETTVEEPVQAKETVHVSIKSFKFVPADVSIKVGDTVVWTNEDSAAHTVESSDNVFRSDELSKGDTFSFTFSKAGKHDYSCGIHPSMHGSVTVQ